MIGRCSGRTSSAVSGDGGASSRSTPGVVLDHDLADELGVDRRRGHDVDDALAVEPEVEEDAVVAELQVAVDEARPCARARGGARSRR